MVREYTKRMIICAASLALFSLGNVFSIKAGAVGTNAWNTLAIGLGNAWHISFGTANLLISGAILVFDLLGKGKLGFGTVLNMLLIPFFSDLFLAHTAFIPEAANLPMGMVYTLSGQMISSFAMILYMMPALGCGPRDTLLIILGKKLPRIPIGAVKFLLETLVLAVGSMLGAPFGLGSITILLLQASMFQFACFVFRYEPRSVVHENFADTFRRWRR